MLLRDAMISGVPGFARLRNRTTVALEFAAVAV